MSRKKIYEKVNCIGIVCIFIVVALELSGKNIRERKAWICVLCDAFFVSGMILLGIGLRKFSNRTYSTILRRKKIIRIKNKKRQKVKENICEEMQNNSYIPDMLMQNDCVENGTNKSEDKNKMIYILIGGIYIIVSIVFLIIYLTA